MWAVYRVKMIISSVRVRRGSRRNIWYGGDRVSRISTEWSSEWYFTCPSRGAACRHHCTCWGGARLGCERRGWAHRGWWVRGETTAGVVRRVNLREREREPSMKPHRQSERYLSFPSLALWSPLVSHSQNWVINSADFTGYEAIKPHCIHMGL